MYDLIIIGAGPAGLSAALYAKRAGMDALTIEQSPVEGGQILTTDVVDNYLGIPEIGGFELGMKFREHALKAGACLQKGTVNKVERTPDGWKLVCGDGSELQTRAVIFATGAEHIPLDVPGEFTYRGKGVSYCATCDGAFFKDRVVVVAGGGNTAVGDALYLARICKKVYLVHRRDQLRASMSLQEELKKCKNVEILWNTTVEKISGGDLMESVTVRTLSQEKESGEMQAAQLGKEQKESVRELEAEGIFIAVGMRPRTALAREIAACDERGYLCAGEDCKTNVPGIFAAGDVRTKRVRQIVTAVADGACAVEAVKGYLDTLG